MATRVIPSYGLYGDQADASWLNSFDFEWIPQRSSVYNWRIRPHKHDAFIQILYLTAGEGEVLLDTERVVFSAPCVVLIPAQTVHGFVFSETVDGPVVTAAQRPLESLATVAMPELLKTLRRPLCMSLQDAGPAALSLMPLFLTIEREAKLHDSGQIAVVLSLLVAICVQIQRLSGLADTSVLKSRKSQQIEKFRALVNEHYRKHWPLSHFADQLGITVGQLSRLCREILGMSSLDVINARLVHEAQRELVYTTSSTKQLAAQLGFSDEAYFSRFFRKHTGLSPRDFRSNALRAMAATPTEASKSRAAKKG